MRKAIGSKIDFDSSDLPEIEEFREIISGLLEADEVKRLSEYFQHCNTTRLQHSFNVSYYSFVIAKKMGCDVRSAARAGMLHDLFWYDWRTEKTPQMHAFYHPKKALENAEKLTELNDIERDAIVNHMWPLSSGMPKYKESYAVTIADKYCATAEIFSQFTQSLKRKVYAVKNIFSKNKGGIS
jgi:uncharacterized protein